MEEESDNKLSFLDVLVSKNSNKLENSVYRKPTFTKLGTNFLSSIPRKFKISAVQTLVHRAYHLSSSYKKFNDEISFLKNYFVGNGYPLHIIDNSVKRFLNKVYNNSPVLTAEKCKVYISIPYMSQDCDKFIASLYDIISSYYPHLDIRLVPTNPLKIGSFFKNKEALPDELRSNIIYEYICDVCQASYIGCTTKQSRVRYFQHLGRSYRTDKVSSQPSHSNIRNHALEHGHPIALSNFKILDSANNLSDLKLLETMYIQSTKPFLNSEQYSTNVLFSY